MNRETAELVNALYAVNQHVPRLATELLAGTLDAAKQHEFAALLIELGELLHSHADDLEARPRLVVPPEGGRRVLSKPVTPTDSPDERSTPPVL